MQRSIVRSSFQVAVAVALIAFATLARADDPGGLELRVGTGYTRALGEAAGGMPELQHLAGNGGAVLLEASWRLDPRWSVGGYYEGSLFADGHEGTDGMIGTAVGVRGEFHARPSARLDPWVGVGLGWRVVRLDHGSGTHAMRGADLARVQVGVDYRVSQRLSVAPVVGVSLTDLYEEKPPGAGAYADVADRKVSAFVFAGVSGRVELGRSFMPCH